MQPKNLTTSSYGSTQHPNIGYGNQQKPSSKLGNKTVYGSLETSLTGSGSVNSPITDAKQDPKVNAWKQLKPSCKLENRSIYSAIETKTTGSGTSSQWIYKKNFGKMLQPFVKNSQVFGYKEKKNPQKFIEWRSSTDDNLEQSIMLSWQRCNYK